MWSLTVTAPEASAANYLFFWMTFRIPNFNTEQTSRQLINTQLDQGRKLSGVSRDERRDQEKVQDGDKITLGIGPCVRREPAVSPRQRLEVNSFTPCQVRAQQEKKKMGVTAITFYI